MLIISVMIILGSDSLISDYLSIARLPVKNELYGLHIVLAFISANISAACRA